MKLRGKSREVFVGTLIRVMEGSNNAVSQRGPVRWSSVRDRQLAVLGVMPDGNGTLIGHWFGVRCCFSCGCVFGVCPIVPDVRLVVLSCFVQPLTYFSLCCRKEK